MSRPGFFAPLPDEVKAAQVDLEAEVKWLRACMERAGLAAFKQNNRTPGEVAEHLHDVARSWADAEALLYGRLERMEVTMTHWREEHLAREQEIQCWRQLRDQVKSARPELDKDVEVLAYLKSLLRLTEVQG